MSALFLAVGVAASGIAMLVGEQIDSGLLLIIAAEACAAAAYFARPG